MLHRSNARILYKSGFKYIVCVITHQVQNKMVQYKSTGKKIMNQLVVIAKFLSYEK